MRMQSQRARRAAGLAGLLAVVGVVVAAKEATGPPSTGRLALPAGQVKPAAAPPSTSSESPTTPPGVTTPAPSNTTGPTTGSTTGPTTTAPVTRQVTGSAYQNPYGTIQVRLTLDGSRIVNVTTLQSPSDRGRSIEIAQDSLPILRQEVLKAQSAQIDSVSGASYDSQGYAQSVQSALDEARA